MTRGADRRAVVRHVVCVLVLLVLATTPAGASASSIRSTATTTGSPPLPAFGAQFHATWSDYTDAQRTVALDRLHAAGATWVRIDVGWETLEPRRGHVAHWYLESLDDAVEKARRRNLSVLLTVFTTPRWANGSRDARIPPRDPDDYGAIMGWLAHRFAGEVGAYEIWNEPDIRHFFRGRPAEYVDLLQAAYPAIREADPDADIVAGATVYNNDAFLASAYEAGARGFFDVWSTHPYMGTSDAPPETPDDGNPWTMDHIRAVRDLMVENGDGDLPIWFTEFGWSSHPTADGAPSWQRGVTEAEQADFLVRAVRFIAEHHPYVTVMIWYTERNTSTGNRHEDNFGLMTRNFRPKPAYTSLKTLLTQEE